VPWTTTTYTHFSVTRNEQFCRAVIEPDVVLKYQKLTQLSMDFITLITNYGRTIISELFLEDGKTVAVKDLGYGERESSERAERERARERER